VGVGRSGKGRAAAVVRIQYFSFSSRGEVTGVTSHVSEILIKFISK
jgi:hypothetical protein